MFIGLSTFSFTLNHCSKLPFSPCRKSCNCKEAAEALEIIFHCVSCFYACRLYQTSSSSFQFVCICHYSHKTFHFITHNKNKWPYSLQSRCCFSSMIVSGLQGKTWAPKHLLNPNKNETEWLYFLCICKEDISFLPTKHYKKKKKDYSAHTFAPFSLRHCDSSVKHLQHPHLVPMSPLLLQRGREEFRPSEMDVPRTLFVYCCWRGDRFRPVIWAFPFTAPSFPLPQSFHWFQHTSLAPREYWLVKC